MSSDSDSEEFFDASEITPIKDNATSSESYERTFLEENNSSSSFSSSVLPVLSEECFFSSQVKSGSFAHDNFFPPKDVQIFEKRSAKLSCLSNPSGSALVPSPLTNKLTTSLPTLHLQDSAVQSPSKFGFFDKQNEANLMPPPSFPSKPQISSLNTESVPGKKEVAVQDTSSACSESLLETLSCVDDVELFGNLRRRGRQDRSSKPHRVEQDQDETSPIVQWTSPGPSSTSSLDAFLSSQNSAPFRVVEVDATSAYSTTFSHGKGSKSNLKQQTTSDVKIEACSTGTVIENIVTDQSSNDITIEEKDYETNPPVTPLPVEPDIVASTKSNSLPRGEIALSCQPVVSSPTPTLPLGTIPLVIVSNSSPGETVASSFMPSDLVPIPPPRKKRAKRKDDDTVSLSSVISLPTPASIPASQDNDTISHHMDMQEASRGSYIVSTEDTLPLHSHSVLKPVDGENKDQNKKGRAFSGDIYKKSSKIDQEERLIKPLLNKSTSSDTNKINKTSSKPESCSLSDEEILKQVSLLNLDTGERMPLSEAEGCILPALNPLSLHIMKLTKEYIDGSKPGDDENADDDDEEETDEEGSIVDVVVRKLPEVDPLILKKKTSQLKKFLGKRVESAVSKAKTFAHKGKEEKDVFEDDTPAQSTMQYVKIKTSHSYKGPHEFDNLMYVQELQGEHVGPVWCMKFSPCGRLLATAGQDHVLRIWVLKQAFLYFLDIRTKWNADVKSSPTPSQESLVSQHSVHSNEDPGSLDPQDDGLAPFMPKPFCIYTGHTADVLDLSWSKSYFMLTSSMDKTVRLWHINRKECLCIFKHVDFVTAIAFHPKDDRYFISGSLDGKLRLWSIPDKQVVLWTEVEGRPQLITAANFCQNGSYIVVGTYNGRCIFYKTDELKYFTQIHVKSSRGKYSQGRKITGIEPLPENDMLLITSNDSRIRLYDLAVLNVACKYRGHSNFSSQIRAGFSHDGKFIISGSENQCIYIWKTHHDYTKFSSARKDRNTYWEGVKAHSAVVTCAIFSPHPEHVFNFIDQQQEDALRRQEQEKEVKSTTVSKEPGSKDSSLNLNKGYVLVSADFNGCIKIFLKREKPKHSSLPASAMV